MRTTSPFPHGSYGRYWSVVVNQEGVGDPAEMMPGRRSVRLIYDDGHKRREYQPTNAAMFERLCADPGPVLTALQRGDVVDDLMLVHTCDRGLLNDQAAAPTPIPDDDGELLTSEERRALALTGELMGCIKRIVGPGSSRQADLGEFVDHVHAIQHALMAQAAARAYPGEFRLLGEAGGWHGDAGEEIPASPTA